MWRWTLFAASALSCFVGCGGNTKIGGTGGDAGSTSDGDAAGDSVPRPAGPGWSIRDATPYSRTEHATVLDEARDRMIVIGGAAGLDVWALPLSGQDKHRGAQIVPEGDSPPVYENDRGGQVSAVYDPFGQRLLVLRADSYEYDTPRIWELTLDDSPAWHELTLEGPAPGAELDFGQMVVDRSGKRLLIVGGGLQGSGTWELSLDGPGRWSRFADIPTLESATTSSLPVINAGDLFVDSPRERLVLINRSDREGPLVWTLPLAGGDCMASRPRGHMAWQRATVGAMWQSHSHRTVSARTMPRGMR